MTDKLKEAEKPKEAPARILWKFHRLVTSIKEVQQKTNYRKKDDTRDPSEENSTYDTITLGWQVRIDDGSAIGLFPENPGYKPGDCLELTIAKKG